MFKSHSRLNEFSNEYGSQANGDRRPYFALLPAMERRIFKPSEDLINDEANPPGVSIASGILPNPKGRGLVRSRSNTLAAFDHVAVRFDGSGLRLFPTSVEDVEQEGRINQPGAVTLETTEGRLKLAAIVINIASDPWAIERFRDGFFMNRVGNLAIMSAIPAFTPEYEVTEIQADGTQIAKELKH